MGARPRPERAPRPPRGRLPHPRASPQAMRRRRRERAGYRRGTYSGTSTAVEPGVGVGLGLTARAPGPAGRHSRRTAEPPLATTPSTGAPRPASWSRRPLGVGAAGVVKQGRDDHAVDAAQQRDRVRHVGDRRGVQHHQVVALSEDLEHPVHGGRLRERPGVVGQAAGHHDLEPPDRIAVARTRPRAAGRPAAAPRWSGPRRAGPRQSPGRGSGCSARPGPAGACRPPPGRPRAHSTQRRKPGSRTTVVLPSRLREEVTSTVRTGSSWR